MADEETANNWIDGWVEGGCRLGSFTGIMMFNYGGDTVVYSKTRLETPEEIETTEFINKTVEGWENFVE